MSKPHGYFLTLSEVLAAIRTDFSQYPPQRLLFLDLCPLVLDKKTSVIKDIPKDGVWLSTGRGRRPAFMPYEDLGYLLCDTLEEQPPPMDHLARICRRVFRTKAVAVRGKDAKTHGIWIETDMGDFACRQCGHCCRTLQFHTDCTIEDYQYWRSIGRKDILEWVGVVRENGKIVSCQIWVQPGTRTYVQGCPWLQKVPEQNRYACRIHAVRPEICRQYPGTRKHAEMTGCIGFSGSQQKIPRQSPMNK